MVRLKDVSKSFNGLKILDSFSLRLEQGTVTGLLGPSGCGKTTICNIISGLIKMDSGEITGADTVSYLFQEPRLLPWYTVYKNLDIVLKKHFEELKRKELIVDMLDMVDLPEYSEYYPDQLSGGMARRVSLARAFIYPGDIVLMDEPFQAIDLKRKLELVDYVNRVWQNTKKTALFVTHDITESILLSDRILVLTDRPASAKCEIINSIPREERNLENDKLIDIEKKLYPLLVE